MKTKAKSKEELLRLFYRLSKMQSQKIISDKDIDKINAMLEKLVAKLPFQNEEEKEQYLDLISCYKFWEDLEKETIRIINNLY